MISSRVQRKSPPLAPTARRKRANIFAYLARQIPFSSWGLGETRVLFDFFEYLHRDRERELRLHLDASLGMIGLPGAELQALANNTAAPG